MTKQDKARCFERFAMMNDNQLLNEYHEQLLNTLGTQTDRMYELGYSMEDIKERERFEKEMSDELHLCEKCLNKREINIWPKPITNREWLESLSDEEFIDKVFYMFVTSGTCDKVSDTDCDAFGDCQKCRLTWLQQEHRELEF